MSRVRTAKERRSAPDSSLENPAGHAPGNGSHSQLLPRKKPTSTFRTGLKIGGHGQTIFATTTIDPQSLKISQEERSNWDTIAELRSEVTKAIEPYRKSGTIGHSLDAHVKLYLDEALQKAVADSGADLKEVLIVSRVETLPLEQADDQCHASEELTGLKVGRVRRKRR